MKYIKFFKDLGRKDAGIAGGKGASLGEMTSAKIPVPPGFVILSDAFEHFLSENNLTEEIEAILSKTNHKEMEQIERASEGIAEMILKGKIPTALQKEIKESFAKLDCKFVAVRSSATAEDGADHAWAGQLDTFLNTTEKKLEENIKRCFASLFTPRAIFYRFEKGLHKSHISVAVVVQKMVQSEKSGIAFSVHPVTEDRNQMIIEASWGLGEAIVSGQVTPDSYVVEKDSKMIIDINVSDKSKGIFKKATGGNEWKNLSSKKAKEQCLSGKEILELGNLIIKIENHYGFPCDIEWAFEKGKFYITQSRPITTLKALNIIEQKEELVLMGAWDTPPLELFHWFDSDSSKHMQGVVGVTLRVFGYSRDGLLYQCFFKNELDELRDKLEAHKTEKDKLKYISKIYDDFWVHVIVLEKYLKLMESKAPESMNNDELGQIVVKCAEVWHKVVMQVWYALFLDVWYPNQHDQTKIKDVAAKARDHAGHLHARSNDIEKKFYEEISSRTGISFEQLRYLHPAEVANALKTKMSYKNTASQRMKFCVVESADKIYKIHEGDDARMFFDKYNPPALGTEPSSSLKGISACKGRVKGRVRIIKLNKEFDSFEEGEVLVSPQTMIHYVPIMSKAAAILTEFGGLTSHAAIVSRELKKPCIVGIKNLLVSLKDGDMVEVDADNGLVKIIKINTKTSTNVLSPFGGKDEWMLAENIPDSDIFFFQIPWSCFTDDTSFPFLKLYKEVLSDYRGFELNFYFGKQDSFEVAESILKALINRPKFGNDVNRNIVLWSQKLVSFANKVYKSDLSKLTSKELFAIYEKHDQIHTKLYTYGWLPVSVDMFHNNFTDNLKGYLRTVCDNQAEVEDAFLALTTPSHKTIIAKEREQFLKIYTKNIFEIKNIASKKQKSQSNVLQKDLDAHSKAWGHQGYIYAGNAELFDVKHYLSEMIDLVKSGITANSILKREKEQLRDAEVKKQRLYKKLKINSLYKKLFNIAIEFSLTKLVRRDAQLRTLWALHHSLLPEIAKRLSVSRKQVQFMLKEEVKTALLDGKINKDEMNERTKNCVMYNKNLFEEVYIGAKADAFRKGIKKDFDNTLTEFTGQVAQPGFATGKVKIIIRAKDMKKMNQGDILVSIATDPDIVPAMKKAAAIVTEQGGITSHAAIVSRELGTPCIIGTKIATKLLKDGDLVEVDAHKGIVRILK